MLSTLTSVGLIGLPVKFSVRGARMGLLQSIVPLVQCPPVMRRCSPSGRTTCLPLNSAVGSTLDVHVITRSTPLLPCAEKLVVFMVPVRAPLQTALMAMLALIVPEPFTPSPVKLICSWSGPAHLPGVRIDVQPATGVGRVPVGGPGSPLGYFSLKRKVPNWESSTS